MLKSVLAAAAALLLMATAAHAATIYSSMQMVGNDQADINISTDGTTGPLTAANILDWQVNLYDLPSHALAVAFLTPANSSVKVLGSALTATATDLTIDLNQLDSALVFETPLGTDYYSVGNSGFVDGDGNPGQAAFIKGGTGGLPSFLPESGNFLIASVPSTVAPVPEPSTWALMLAGLAAVGGMFFFTKKKNQQEQAAAV